MIEIKREPENLGNDFEPCCFCGKETAYWSVKKDVACCPDCASKYNENEVPNKFLWIMQQINGGLW